MEPIENVCTNEAACDRRYLRRSGEAAECFWFEISFSPSFIHFCPLVVVFFRLSTMQRVKKGSFTGRKNGEKEERKNKKRIRCGIHSSRTHSIVVVYVLQNEKTSQKREVVRAAGKPHDLLHVGRPSSTCAPRPLLHTISKGEIRRFPHQWTETFSFYILWWSCSLFFSLFSSRHFFLLLLLQWQMPPFSVGRRGNSLRFLRYSEWCRPYENGGKSIVWHPLKRH